MIASTKNKKTTYKDAGVDTSSAGSFVDKIKNLQTKYFNIYRNHSEHHPSKSSNYSKQLDNKNNNENPKHYPSAMDFVALTDISFLKRYKRPLLASTNDGVGTKLHLAQLFNYHKTIGVDLVAMCSNDLLCSGAKTIGFLDYISCGKLQREAMEQVIESIMQACQFADCVLLGGETAEHPNLMSPKQYDLAGFAFGVLEAEDLIDGSTAQEGDLLLGLASSGLHANGFSLIRQLYLKDGLTLPESQVERDFIFNKILCPPTLIYEPILRPLLEKNSTKKIKGIAHITGGGFYENIPRILKKNLAVEIKKDAWKLPELFVDIQKRSGLDFKEMLGVFNMGIGMVIIVSPQDKDAIISELKAHLAQHYSKLVACGSQAEVNTAPVQDTITEPVVLGKIVTAKGSKKASSSQKVLVID